MWAFYVFFAGVNFNYGQKHIGGATTKLNIMRRSISKVKKSILGPSVKNMLVFSLIKNLQFTLLTEIRACSNEKLRTKSWYQSMKNKKNVSSKTVLKSRWIIPQIASSCLSQISAGTSVTHRCECRCRRRFQYRYFLKVPLLLPVELLTFPPNPVKGTFKWSGPGPAPGSYLYWSRPYIQEVPMPAPVPVNFA